MSTFICILGQSLIITIVFIMILTLKKNPNKLFLSILLFVIVNALAIKWDRFSEACIHFIWFHKLSDCKCKVACHTHLGNARMH